MKHLTAHRTFGFLGVITAALAWRAGATPSGAIAGAIATLAACAGAGGLLRRLLDHGRGFGHVLDSAHDGSSDGSSGAASAPSLPLATLVGDLILGLAGFLLVGAALAAAGLFTPPVQLGLLAAGLLACALPTAPTTATWPRLAAALVALAGLLTITLEAFDLAPILSDATNHALALARLWQLGDAAALPRQLGGQLVGESLFALPGGLASAGLFDAGVAPALLICLLAEELVTRPPSSPGAAPADPADLSGPRASDAATQRFALLALLALPIVIHPDIPAAPTARWSTTLLHLAALLRLRRVLAASSSSPTSSLASSAAAAPLDLVTLVLAAAMVVLRLELLLLATALVAGALFLPRRPALAATLPAAPLAPAGRVPQRRLLVLALWTLAVLALQVAVRPPNSSTFLLIALVLVIPPALLLTALALRLIGLPLWRDELSVAAAGAIATTLLGATGTAGSIQQVVFAAWFSLLVLALIHSFAPPLLPAPPSSSTPTPTPLHALRGPMGLVLALSTGLLVLRPALHPSRRDRIVDRVARTLGAAPELRALGFDRLDRLGQSGLAALQARVPAGAPLGFWGTHPGALDLRRNPVVDLSWPRRRAGLTTFLSPLTFSALDEADFLLVENVKKWLPGGMDPWGSAETGATGLVESSLELVAEAPSARLYRIRK